MFQLNRSDGAPHPPERIVRYDSKQCAANPGFWWSPITFSARPQPFEVVSSSLLYQKFFFSFLFFFPSFFFLFLVFLGFLEREKGCPFVIQEVPSSGLKRLKLKKCSEGPRHKRTSYRIQFLWILLRVKAKFCIFQSHLLFPKFNPGEGRDILYINLFQFC